MRKFKITIFGSLLVLLGATLFWACSDEESVQSDTKANLRTFSSGELGNLGHFLNQFYDREVTFVTGRTRTVREEAVHYDCTEIIIDSDTRARGYLVSDHSTGQFLHFGDVDRTNYVLKTQNLITNERETTSGIHHHPDYSLTDGFDIIGVIGTNPVVQPSGWFWGQYCTLDVDENGYPNFQTTPATSGSPAVEYCTWTCVTRRFGFSFGEPRTDVPGGCGASDGVYPVVSYEP